MVVLTADVFQLFIKKKNYSEYKIIYLMRYIKESSTETIRCAAVCYTRGPLEMFVQLHGMTALLQLLYMLLLLSTAVTIHTPQMPQARLRRTRLAPPPDPSTAPASSAQPKFVHTPTKCHWDLRAEHPLCTLCYYILELKSWKTSAVSTTDWMVETQLCKLLGTTYIRHVRWTFLFYISFIL